ncbi:hypothetical protein DDE82_000856 [Stemphylium lycopersici]|nr:hypothetical protein TW65_05915 [Stemphylium lycopersici]RAR10885.1 hypothetical protein DDE82_000856 [Stemphylium lycopersici]
MGYFERFSGIPPSPTPSASSHTSSSNDVNTPDRSPSSISFFSVLKGHALPLAVRNFSGKSATRPPTPPRDADDNNDNDNDNSLRYSADSGTNHFDKSNEPLVWRRGATENEYETMPLKRREGALDRVNRSRAWLGLPEKNLDKTLRPLKIKTVVVKLPPPEIARPQIFVSQPPEYSKKQNLHQHQPLRVAIESSPRHPRSSSGCENAMGMGWEGRSTYRPTVRFA